MSDSRDWREAVRRRAHDCGVELPPEVIDELAEHLEEVEAATLAAGSSADAARLAALAALATAPLGGLHRGVAGLSARQWPPATDSRRRRTLGMGSALRLAIRQLRQHPRLALTTMLVLGLGAGAATTVFTIVDSVVLRPLPFAQPDRLVTLWDRNVEKEVQHDPISPVNFLDYRGLPVFADAAAWWRPAVNLLDPGLEPARVKTIEASTNLFDVLGVRPQLGQGFGNSATLFLAGEKVAVISDRLWRTRYGGSRGVLGRQLSLDGETYTVVGVMPPRFHFPDDVDVWQRLDWDLAKHSRHAHFMEAVARLRPGKTVAEAQAACDALAERLAKEYAPSNLGWSTRLVPLLDEQLGYYRPALMVLFGAVGLLLLMAILNVASLLLARALQRQREISVRIALGAAARQLVTQLMAESLVLSLGGAVLAIGFAAVLLRLVVSLAPVNIPRLDEAVLDWRALGACLVAAAASAVVFGLVPALLLLRRQVAGELKSGERGSSRAARRIYSVLVAAEVAAACALLVGSALLIRTVHAMTRTPIGVHADGVLTAPLQVTRGDAKDAAGALLAWQRVADTHHRILETVRRQPGVMAAGLTNFLPLQTGWRDPFEIVGQPKPAREEDAPQAQLQSASDGYFEAMGARLVTGRAFLASDSSRRPGVLVVNQSFARRYLPAGAVGSELRMYVGGVGPLGRNLLWTPEHRHDGQVFTVVGVVADVRNAPLAQPSEPAIYFSTRQFPFAEMTLAIDATSPETAVAALRRAVQQAAPEVPIADTRTWGERMREHTAEPRLLMTTLVLFGLLASLLAAIGIYGLFSWSVALRTRELAIRLTLGALPASVGKLVLRQTALLLGVGLLAGVAAVRLVSALLARVLYRVAPDDLVSIAVAALVLVVAAVAACAVPARRAMRLDPVTGLRAE